jgi:hypothetical protein
MQHISPDHPSCHPEANRRPPQPEYTYHLHNRLHHGKTAVVLILTIKVAYRMKDYYYYYYY